MSFPAETQGRRETDKEAMTNSLLRASAPPREISVWVVKRIGDCCDVLNGGTPKTGVAEYWDGEHAWVTPAEMGKRSSPYIDETSRTLTNAGLENCSANPLPPNSVILSSRAPIGHLVINTLPMAFNQGCKGLVPKKELHHKFLYYFLYASVDLLNSLGTGATFKELSGGKLKDVEIPVPSLPEQERIVDILDEAFDGIAKAKTTAEANLQNARCLFQSHLQTVFSQRGEGWVEKPLEQLVDILDSKRKPITKRDRIAGEYPYYGATGIQDYVAGFIFDEPLVLVGEDGAKWASGDNTAFAVSGRCWVNNHAHVLRPLRNALLDNWLIYFFNHSDLSEFVSGLTVPKLNQGSLRSIPIPVPPINVQERLLKIMDALLSETQRLESLYQNKLIALDELKKSLLHQAFTGNL
jgi:type I restriction enzyme, S subunit